MIRTSVAARSWQARRTSGPTPTRWSTRASSAEAAVLNDGHVHFAGDEVARRGLEVSAGEPDRRIAITIDDLPWATLGDETPEGKSIVTLAKRAFGLVPPPLEPGIGLAPASSTPT